MDLLTELQSHRLSPSVKGLPTRITRKARGDVRKALRKATTPRTRRYYVEIKAAYNRNQTSTLHSPIFLLFAILFKPPIMSF